MQAALAILLPGSLLTILCVVGGMLAELGRPGRGRRRLGLVLLGVGLAGFAAVLLLPADEWALRPLENRFAAPQSLSHIDGIVVLGGGIAAAATANRGTPSLNRDGDRLAAFAILARAHPEARLVFAGGPPATGERGLTEAAASRQLLEALGLPQGRVLYDDRSLTTWENAVNAFVLARPKPDETWLLVTSASHMPRAMGAFRQAGWMDIAAWPVAYRTAKDGWATPMRPVSTKLATLDLAAHEWIGLAAYRLQGRSDRFFPRQ